VWNKNREWRKGGHGDMQLKVRGKPLGMAGSGWGERGAGEEGSGDQKGKLLLGRRGEIPSCAGGHARPQIDIVLWGRGGGLRLENARMGEFKTTGWEGDAVSNSCHTTNR